MGGGFGPGPGSGASKICVNFDQAQEAYKSKDSLELLRGLVVLKLCSYDFLVDRNQEVRQLQLNNKCNLISSVKVNR